MGLVDKLVFQVERVGKSQEDSYLMYTKSSGLLNPLSFIDFIDEVVVPSYIQEIKRGSIEAYAILCEEFMDALELNEQIKLFLGNDTLNERLNKVKVMPNWFSLEFGPCMSKYQMEVGYGEEELAQLGFEYYIICLQNSISKFKEKLTSKNFLNFSSQLYIQPQDSKSIN